MRPQFPLLWAAGMIALWLTFGGAGAPADAAAPPTLSIPAAADDSTADSDNPLVLENLGIIESEGPSHNVPSPDASSGHATIFVGNPRIVVTSSLICAHLGTWFGIQIRLKEGLPYGSLGISVETDHPPFRNPRGQMQSRDDTDGIVYPGQSKFTGWQFQDPSRMVDGTWIFVVRHKERILLRQSFEVHFGCTTPIK